MTSNEQWNDLAHVSGLRGNERASHLLKGKKSSESARDSVGRSDGRKGRRYVTTRKAREALKRLSGRDLEVIDILETVHLASGRQLQTLLHGQGLSAARTARRQLENLTDHGVLTRLERRPRGVRGGSLGYVYALDVLGQAIVGVPQRRRRPRLPGVTFLDHAVTVTDCFVVLKQLEAAGQLELLSFQAEPECWRDFAGPGYVRVLKADAYLVTASDDYEDRWLIEVDRSTESKARLKTKCLAHLDYYLSGREQAESGIAPRVLWVVPDDERQAQLVEVLASLPAEHWQLFMVCPLDRFGDVIIAGAGETSEVAP
jgi:hypothetical protein